MRWLYPPNVFAMPFYPLVGVLAVMSEGLWLGVRAVRPSGWLPVILSNVAGLVAFVVAFVIAPEISIISALVAERWGVVGVAYGVGLVITALTGSGLSRVG